MAVRKGVLRLIALAIGTAGGLLLLEIGVRIFHSEATRPFIVGELEGARYSFVSSYRPDAEFHHVAITPPPQWSRSDGMPLQFPSPSEFFQKRVMLVGDSFTMGYGVGKEKRFGTLLQHHLGEGIKVDVLATSSYSPVIYRNLVRKALSIAAYSVVAVFVDQTDPTDDLLYQEDLLDDVRCLSYDRADAIHR